MRRTLLAWYGRKARALPWRKAHTSYAVWVSELMLQQTQVATVIPYYPRFVRAFPSVRQLAKAPRERVLELWSGLGYYRRARDLHEGARVIVKKFGGRFPQDYEQARSLPGVGDYTARAVLSITFNLPYAVLDGNVARVVARLDALRGSLHQLPFRRRVERKLDRLLSCQRPGHFNQALMELGQTVCLPRGPRCQACPLQRWCEGHRRGNPELYPSPRPRRATELRYLAAAVIRRRESVGMVRGLDEGLLGDLWNFPAAFGSSRAEALRQLHRKMARILGGRARHATSLGKLRHRITHRTIQADLYLVEVPGHVRTDSLRWFPVGRLPHAAVSQLARKIAARL